MPLALLLVVCWGRFADFTIFAHRVSAPRGAEGNRKGRRDHPSGLSCLALGPVVARLCAVLD